MRAIVVSSFGLLLSLASQESGASNAGNTVVWVDATGAVVAPYIRGEAVPNLFIDDAGFVWALDAEHARVSALPIPLRYYPSPDCTGTWYLNISGSIRPREVLSILDLHVLLARADDVAGQTISVLSVAQLGGCFPFVDEITVVPCTSLRVVESEPDLGAVPPLHLERR